MEEKILVNRNTKIVLKEECISNIVHAILKGISSDIDDYIQAEKTITTNGLPFIRSDFINTNLEKIVINSEYLDLISFKKTSWEGIILIDNEDQITYSIISNNTLERLLNNNQKNPHYLRTIIHILNNTCEAINTQLSLNGFDINRYNYESMVDDFNKITKGRINSEGDFRHYIIAYKAGDGILENVELKFYDKNLNEIDSMPLMNYINPDFSELTASSLLHIEEEIKDTVDSTKKLITPKLGIKLQSLDIEKNI